ncbi:haloacid dehalogenase superfamily, subfamily IA, variant 3 with third motif having DD or ED [Methanococcoides vulcani]|uniref:Haloacid dehalogenase superfamily, subfamily IA, variant 3 with third motif having DD or ED n=1 Tax=Methanococcoides vulcani TaxID=1353158 RepID=A0A1I0AM17_9EURY|nr:HAD family phosphatase [Methanococcoides vulcani]SES95338.1 haloacid dehalogenase superfamily, subfamily IA, variant 3 with third motif having DD or ED [Methanococcoides vulcani]
MLKVLIFDMDGVLVDSMSYHTEAMQHIFDELGINMDKQDIYDKEGSKTVEIVSFLLEKEGIDPLDFDVDGLIKRYRTEFARILVLKSFREIDECLPILRERFMLSVVSGADRNIVHDVIGRLFDDIFDIVLSGEDVEKGKPAPDPFLKVAEMLDVGISECLVVENAPMGVEAANRAGMFCVGVPTYVSKESIMKADKLVDDHRMLKEFLLGLEHPEKEEVESLRLIHK